jgi:tetratricopeptide (TPR) repeat protein
VSREHVSVSLVALSALLVAGGSAAGVVRAQDAPLPTPAPLCAPGDHPEAQDLAETSERRALLEAGRFETLSARLEAEGARGQNTGDVYARRRFALDRLYGVEVLPLLDAWCAQAPDDPVPLMLRGASRIDWAWEARGGGWADTVTEEGWRLFFQRLHLAQADLERAVELDPGETFAYTHRITVAMGLGEPEEVARDWLRRSLEQDPGDIEPARRLMTYLLPKWHGTQEKVWELVVGLERSYPDAAYGLLRVALYWELGSHAQGFWEREDVQADVQAALDRVLESYPRCNEALSWRIDNLRQDDPSYLHWLERCSDRGRSGYMQQWGALLATGRLGSDRVEEGLLLLCRAAHRDQPDALYELGVRFLRGLALPQDGEAGLAYIRRSAECGSPHGMDVLGGFYARGAGGVEQDSDQAIRLYLAAAERGLVDSMAKAGSVMVARDDGRADAPGGVRLLNQAAAQGSMRALLDMGTIAIAGEELGVQQDLPRAADMFRHVRRVGSPAEAQEATQFLSELLAQHPELRRAGDPP